MNTAQIAAEYRSNIGQDLCLEAELADFAESEAAEQEAEDERLEHEGRREIYAMLELSDY